MSFSRCEISRAPGALVLLCGGVGPAAFFQLPTSASVTLRNTGAPKPSRGKAKPRAPPHTSGPGRGGRRGSRSLELKPAEARATRSEANLSLTGPAGSKEEPGDPAPSPTEKSEGPTPPCAEIRTRTRRPRDFRLRIGQGVPASGHARFGPLSVDLRYHFPESPPRFS